MKRSSYGLTNDARQKKAEKHRFFRRGRARVLTEERKPVIVDVESEVIKLMLDNFYDGIPSEKGLFLSQHDDPAIFTALDNSCGKMLMEEFGDRFTAEKWLRKDR